MTTSTDPTPASTPPRLDGDYERIAAAIRFLDAEAPRQPSLDELAAHLHLSPSHAQRLFTRWAGTSPKRFLRFTAARAARELLQERRAVLDVTDAVGLSSTGRLHDLTVTLEGLTPGEVADGAAGVPVTAGFARTPFGDAVVARTPRGICTLVFPDEEEASTDEVVEREVRRAWPGAALRRDDDDAAATIAPAFAGGAVSVHVKGTNLQLKVWEALLRIPAGRVASYGDVATAIGRPTAVRAVASAVGRNPVGVLIPCHRVLRSTGALGGYAWGLDRKRALLAREAATIEDPPRGR